MTTLTVRKPEVTALSRDLRETLGEDILLKLALGAVGSMNAARLETMARNTSTFRPQMMLTLLSYCYAAGIYASQEIERCIRDNRMVRYICAHQYPDWQAIRRFRRLNRELVDQCLSYVLKKAWLLELDQSGEEWSSSNSIGGEIDKAIAAAVRNKIELAIIMDTAESD